MQQASLPGGGRPTEDFVLCAPGILVVLDGLTSPPSLGTGCSHGTPWYVRRLACNLVERAAARAESDLGDVLSEAIDVTRGNHGGACDLTHPGTPSATVAVLRAAAATFDYLVLSDTTVVIDRSDQALTVVTDPRGEAMEPELKAEVQAAPYGTEERVRLTEKWITVQRGYRNQKDGYWIAGALPGAAYHALTGTVQLDGLVRAGALTDGASRWVDLFGLGGWSAALDVMDRDPGSYLQAVRACEDQDPECVRWPRWKKSDDAALGLITSTQPPR